MMPFNASTRSRAACLLLGALVLALAAGCRTNPVTGGRELVLVGAADELSMGDSYHPTIIFMYDGEYQDPELKRYLGTIVRRLHHGSHRRQMRTDFTVLNTSVVNAFAIPGHVYATRGFLARLDNEAQFASVMGHELAHVAAGHSAKQMTNQALAALGLGLVQGVLGDSLAAQGAAVAGQASIVLLGFSYSREQERQADRVGTYYLALAGWDPRQSISVQRLLHSLDEGKDEGILDRYLTTHPPTENRISEIEGVIRDKGLDPSPYLQGDGVYAARWNRRLASLRRLGEAYGAYDEGNKHLAAKRYTPALGAGDRAVAMAADQAPFHRLRGDALLGLRRLGEARDAYGRSLRLDPRYVPANIGLGQVALAERDYREAERQFAVAAHGYPGSPRGHYGLGLARYHQAKYQEAIAPLETAARIATKDPTVHYVLAVCYDRTGRYTEAYNTYARALDLGLEGEQAAAARSRMAVLAPRGSP